VAAQDKSFQRRPGLAWRSAYTGDAYLRDWPKTLDGCARRAEKPVPGRGDALVTPEQVEAGLKAPRISSRRCLSR
jgi:hypothetical protein